MIRLRSHHTSSPLFHLTFSLECLQLYFSYETVAARLLSTQLPAYQPTTLNTTMETEVNESILSELFTLLPSGPPGHPAYTWASRLHPKELDLRSTSLQLSSAQPLPRALQALGLGKAL